MGPPDTTTENRGVPSSSLGLAIKEGLRQRRGLVAFGASRAGGRVEIRPVKDPLTRVGGVECDAGAPPPTPPVLPPRDRLRRISWLGI